MTTENFNFCKEILTDLTPDLRYWGRHLDAFLLAYKSLNAEERDLLNQQTASSVRHGLMYQYFSHVSRLESRCNDSERAEILQNVFYLLTLDNCDHEYRDTILSLRRMLEKMSEKCGPNFLDESWVKYRHILSDKALSKVKNTLIQFLG